MAKLQNLPADIAREARTMAWSASWYASNKAAGNAAEAAKCWNELETSTAAAMQLLPQSEAALSVQTIEDLRDMALSAAWYTAHSRLSTAGAGSSLDCARGDMSSAEVAKAQFDSRSAFLAASLEISPKLASNLKWMCWNAAWCAANSKKGFSSDARKDKAQFERRHRCVAGRILRGVHLSGWLVLERWLCAQAFLGLREADVPDEHALCRKLSVAERTKHFAAWRSTFITRQDMADIAAAGFNSVRLPFGFWALEGIEEFGLHRDPFVGPCVNLIDQALQWARDLRLMVVLELRGAPGYENGDGSCGRRSDAWQPKHWNVPATLQVVQAVAERYKDHPAVVGFAVLGSPSAAIPPQQLAQYYTAAYKAVRGAGMSAYSVTVHFSVHGRGTGDLLALGFPPREMEDVVLDVTRTLQPDAGRHFLTLAQVLKQAKEGCATSVGESIAYGRETVVAYWNLEIPELSGAGGRTSIGGDWEALAGTQQEAFVRELATAQLDAHKKASGSFFLAWKTDPPTRPTLSARGAIARGWLPMRPPPSASSVVEAQGMASRLSVTEGAQLLAGEEARGASDSDGDDSASIAL